MPYEFCGAAPPKHYDGPTTSPCYGRKGHAEGQHLWRNEGFFGYVFSGYADGEKPPQGGPTVQGRIA